MKQRASVLLMLFSVILLAGPGSAKGQEFKTEAQTRQSWSLEFTADTPQLYVHKDARGDRTTYLYITYRIRNNFGRPVPLEPHFILKTDHETYHPASANPDVEHDIITQEANLRGFSEGVRGIKVKNLKQEGRYLSVDDLSRGFYLRHQMGEGTSELDIQPLRIRSFETIKPSEGRIPYQVFLKEGPADRSGEPYDRRLTEHPAEVTGLLLFEGVDLNTRQLTLKVGHLIDPIVRVQSFDVQNPRKFRLEPHTLYLKWDWNVPANAKPNRAPEFLSREMKQERVGPVARRNTIRSLIDILASGPEEATGSGSGASTMQSVAVSTLRDLTGKDFGYDPAVDQAENENALREWEKWWTQNKHDLLYILAKPEGTGTDSDPFYTYPEPRYIVLKKRTNQTGKESPQDLFQSIRSGWNNQNWQDVMNLLDVEQRNKKTMERLFQTFGFGSELGVAENYQDTDDANRRIVNFKHQGSTEKFELVQRDSGWFFQVPSEK